MPRPRPALASPTGVAAFLVAACLGVTLLSAFGTPVGAAEEVPSIEVRGRSVPLDGSPLPADLTPAERLEVFAAAHEALTGPVRPSRGAAEGPDWAPVAGLAEVWCTQSNPGYGGCAGHHDRPAIDFGVPVGTPVLAAGPGIVVAADTGGGGRGTFVDLAHPDGSSSHYYHLSALEVAPGQSVDRGDRLGRSGSTGSSTAPHLHYEEHGPDGQPRPVGPMGGLVGGRTVSYPQEVYGLDWADVAYGSLLANEGYRPPVDGDLDGDGRPERAAGALAPASGPLGASASPMA